MRFLLFQTILLLTATSILAAPHPLHSTITQLTSESTTNNLNILPLDRPLLKSRDATLLDLKPIEDLDNIDDEDKEAKNWLSGVFSSFTGLFKKKKAPAPKPKITTADVGSPVFVGSSLGW